MVIKGRRGPGQRITEGPGETTGEQAPPKGCWRQGACRGDKGPVGVQRDTGRSRPSATGTTTQGQGEIQSISSIPWTATTGCLSSAGEQELDVHLNTLDGKTFVKMPRETDGESLKSPAMIPISGWFHLTPRGSLAPCPTQSPLYSCVFDRDYRARHDRRNRVFG